MKRFLVVALVLGLGVSVASATDLNLGVTDSNGNDTITVSPGDTVNYLVSGVLSDNTNEGLALIGWDLVFDGGDLPQGDTPTQDPMLNFVRNAGITNPAGYGGTVINGDLVQCGGGQNTIMNFAGNADFPIGTVITGVASSQQDFMAGSFTAPTQEGTYTLAIQNVFANVIKQGETGDPFWATEAAGVGTVSNLTVIVGTGGCNGNEKIKKAKCKVKNGAVKKAIVKLKNGTPNQTYTCTLDTGQTQDKTANSNGKATFKFKGGDAPPCGTGNGATICDLHKTFDCAC